MAINPKIKQKVEDIRKKIFGSEVRESLASGLEGMSEDVESIKGRQDNVENQFQDVLDETTGKDVINGPEIIAARNGKSNLKTRLDEEHAQVTAQLQQTEQELSSQLAQTTTYLEQIAINIKTLGAKADGVTDVRPFIQQAIDMLPPWGGTVLIPSGSNFYAMSSANPENGQHAIIVNKPNVVIKTTAPASPNKVTIRQTSEITGAMFHLTKDAWYFQAKNLYVDAFDNAGFGFVSDEFVSRLTFDNVIVGKASLNGFNLQCYLSKFIKCGAYYCRLDGFAIRGKFDVQGTSVSFDNCFALDNARYGFFLDVMTYSEFNNCACDGGEGSYFLRRVSGGKIDTCGNERTHKSIILDKCENVSINNFAMPVIKEGQATSLIDIIDSKHIILSGYYINGTNYDYAVTIDDKSRDVVILDQSIPLSKIKKTNRSGVSLIASDSLESYLLKQDFNIDNNLSELPIPNTVLNSNFKDGLTNWSVFNSTSNVDNNKLQLIGDGTSANIYAIPSKRTDIGRTYYTLAKFRVLDDYCSELRVVIENAKTVSVIAPKKGEWYTISQQYTTTKDNDTFQITALYSSPTLANGKKVEIKFVYVADLTAQYGGIIPDYLTVDNMMVDFFRKSYKADIYDLLIKDIKTLKDRVTTLEGGAS